MKTIKILSNVSSSLVHRHLERIELELKAKKEADENLRDEYQKIFGSRYPSEWMLNHKQDYLDGKFYGYRYNDYNYVSSSNQSDYVIVYFYEWSDVNGNQLTFYSFNKFKEYCDANNINITSDDETYIRKEYTAYVSCLPYKNGLIITSTRLNLEKALERAWEKYASMGT